MLEGMHDDKIIKNNNKKYENTSLCEPAGSQKESEKVTTIEEKMLSKAILIVDDDPDMTSVFSLGLQDEGFEVYAYMIL
jgi:PleD family two-component response regulator